jgi:hypothetical protein
MACLRQQATNKTDLTLTLEIALQPGKGSADLLDSDSICAQVADPLPSLLPPAQLVIGAPTPLLGRDEALPGQSLQAAGWQRLT